MTSMDDVLRALEESPSWLILSHERPDGDTVGSASALAEAAEHLGKKWRWMGKDPVPESLAFLPHVGRFEVCNTLPRPLGLPEPVAVVAVDISAPGRAPENDPLSGAKSQRLVVIDHHSDNSLGGPLALVDSQAAATGEIVWGLFQRAGWPLSLAAAEALFVAIATDCGFFTYSNTTVDTLRVAMHLVQLGVRPAAIFDQVNARAPLGKLHLWGRALERAVQWHQRRVGFSFLEDEDFLSTGTDRTHIEGLVNQLLLLEGTDFAVLLTEQQEMTSASLRSKGTINAQRLAHRWGGGGHPQAAGFRVRRPWEEVAEEVKKELGQMYFHGDSCSA